ncbi:MAG: hypothetical protein JST67_10795 [Bacteroidetes bacterium]|nr:hypothetical protein [Bacteroidota bacterium]
MKKLFFFFLLFLSLFLLSLAPFIYTHTDYYEFKIKPKKERYNYSLAQKITTIPSATRYIDSLYYTTYKKSKIDTALYIKQVTQFVKESFYHNVLNYSAQENWIANLCGKLFWSHFSAVVSPDDIIKHPKAICSQQAIVYMELLKNKGIKSRKVGLGHKKLGHFITEIWYDKGWHLYDVNKEPDWDKITNPHKSMEYYKQNPDTLYKVYESKISRATFNELIQKVEYGQANAFPAPRMLWFHRITKILTYLLPCLFFVLTAYYFLKIRAEKRKKSSKTYVPSPVAVNS